MAGAALIAGLCLLNAAGAVASAPPSIDSESVSNVTESDATLAAQIDPHGAFTAYEFQIDTSGAYEFTQMACGLPLPGYMQCMAIIVGQPLPPGLHEPEPGSIPAAYGDQPVSLDLASIGTTLQPGTTYHYRVIASNDGQDVTGADQTFATGPAPLAGHSGEAGGDQPPAAGPPSAASPRHHPARDRRKHRPRHRRKAR